MKAILVFIDDTICDTRPRHSHWGTPGFYAQENILKNLAVPGSVECLQALANLYQMVYIGARPASTLADTQAWLQNMGFPEGPVLLGETQETRLALVKDVAKEFVFIAGVGDRYDDNELHCEIDCRSIILKEYEGQWDAVTERILRHHRQAKIKDNETHLRGKIEGLARVCPLLLSHYGAELWEAFYAAVLDLAERTREERSQEDLRSFAAHDLNPADLRDAARWDAILREKDWENNPVYGLQDFELVEAGERRYVHKVTRCLYADLWKAHGRPDIGYQIHCHTDAAWWDRPAWNPQARFEQPKTLMQGDANCEFIQYIPEQSARNLE